MTWMTYKSSVIDAAIVGSAEFEGFAPKHLNNESGDLRLNFKTVMGWYAEVFGPAYDLDDPPENGWLNGGYIRSIIESGIYMPELRNFGPSAAFIVREADRQVSGG